VRPKRFAPARTPLAKDPRSAAENTSELAGSLAESFAPLGLLQERQLSEDTTKRDPARKEETTAFDYMHIDYLWRPLRSKSELKPTLSK